MIKATIMIWFENESGESRYSYNETRMYPWDAQDAADFYASTFKMANVKFLITQHNK